MNMNPTQIKQMLNNPQFKSKVQQMYSAWKGDQQAFINSMFQDNPQLNNNNILKSVLSGRANPHQLFNMVLGQCGLTEQDFMSLLK